jgi:hypothetical protein
MLDQPTAVARRRPAIRRGLRFRSGVAEIAGMIAASFVATVIRRRAELEAGGATPRVLN